MEIKTNYVGKKIKDLLYCWHIKYEVRTSHPCIAIGGFRTIFLELNEYGKVVMQLLKMCPKFL